MIDINIADYYNPEYDVIDIRDSPNILYNGFCFVIGLNYLTLNYNDEQIANAKLTKSSKTIKSNKEFDKLVKGALGVFDEEAPVSENDIKELIEAVDYFIAESLNSDADLNYKGFKNTLFDNPSDAKALIKLAQIMEDEFKIKGVNEDGERSYYYWDSGVNTYLPLNDVKYQELVFKEHGITLPPLSAKNSLESIICDKTIRRDVWEYANGYYNPATEDFISKDTLEDPILTSRQFKYPTGELISYTKGVVEYENDTETLWEKTLREILIPKINQGDKKLYYDFLALASVCLEQNNKWKILPIWYNDTGNNGKSIIKNMLSLIYGSAYFEPSAEDIKDNFFFSRADDTNLIAMDETELNTFKKWEALIKSLTGGAGNNRDIRKMRSDKNHKSKGFGLFMIFTNDIPEFSQKKALLKRLYFGKFPNEFEDAEKITKDNQYPINLNLWEDLQKDYKGMEWFANLLIKAHKELEKPVQDEDFKKQVLSENDSLGLFLKGNYEFDEDGILTIPNIIEDIQKNINLNKKLSENTKNISIIIGQHIKLVFGDIKKRAEGNARAYKLKRIGE